MSYPEVLLWQRLRGSPNGCRFRRGHPIGLDYIADFFCAAAGLVVEVDGAIHDQPRAVMNDSTRDAFMRERGLIVIRVPARAVLQDADAVATAIVDLAAKPLHQPAAGPPPRTGEDQGS